MKQDYTAIKVLVDRSGSMYSIKSDAEGALSAFVKEQALLPGTATLSLSQFDTIYDDVYKSTPLDDVPAYELKPRNGTALNDALGKSIQEFGEELAALSEDERPGTVIFVTITDGFENSSKEFNKAAVKKLVEQQTNEWNWNFVFLAANQDAVLTGADYGFDKGSSLTFNANAQSVSNVSDVLNVYAAATRSGLKRDFTDKERESTQV
jgi:hypothetical protein